MIAIIDYKMGNLGSVSKALTHLHYDSVITSDPSVIAAASGVILPGVGAFGPAMKNIRAAGLDNVIKGIAEKGTPFLGICLGMQLLFDSSEESESVKGLGIIHGRVLRFPSERGLKVPQMGWNRLTKVTGSLLTEGDYVYFVHSFYCCPDNESDCAAYTDYSVRYCSAVERGNIFATQFHPEKSGEAGLEILNRFAGRTRQ